MRVHKLFIVKKIMCNDACPPACLQVALASVNVSDLDAKGHIRRYGSFSTCLANWEEQVAVQPSVKSLLEPFTSVCIVSEALQVS